MNKELVILARLGAPYGVKGWIKVQSFTDSPDNLLDLYQHCLIQQNHHSLPHQLEACQRYGNGLIAKIKGINDRDLVRQFTHCNLVIAREHLPATNAEEFYLHDLKGLDVYNQDQIYLGKLVDFQQTGSNDVFIVRGDKEHWLPYTDDVIQKIDLKNRRIEAIWDPEF